MGFDYVGGFLNGFIEDDKVSLSCCDDNVYVTECEVQLNLNSHDVWSFFSFSSKPLYFIDLYPLSYIIEDFL